MSKYLISDKMSVIEQINYSIQVCLVKPTGLLEDLQDIGEISPIEECGWIQNSYITKISDQMEWQPLKICGDDDPFSITSAFRDHVKQAEL